MPSTFIRQTGKLIEVNRRGSGARTSRDYDNIPSPMVDNDSTVTFCPPEQESGMKGRQLELDLGYTRTLTSYT